MNRFAYGFIAEIEKIARIKTHLLPHQSRVVERIQQEDQPGLVVAHGLGSGKTLTSIAAQEALGLPGTVVVPAGLRENYLKERRQHQRGKGPSTKIVSMQNIAAKSLPPRDPLMIVDEAHRARDPGTKTYQTISKNTAKKRLLLTGSPFYNHPADIASLVDVAAGSNVLPKDRAEFSDRYIALNRVNPGLFARYIRGIRPGVVETINPRHKKELEGILHKWVDYHPGEQENFPTVKREDVTVPMTSKQLKSYDTMMGNAPPWVAYKIKSRLPPSKSESKQLNAFLSAVRQISNTTQPFHTEGEADDPKISTAFDNLQKHLAENEHRKAIVYSNYLEGGISPYKQRLIKAKIPFGEYTGEMSREARDELVRQYNANKLRTLLLSSAGGEGLDLKGTSLIQVLEPHWNEEKLKQVEGRGIRYKSHADLPPAERNVIVQRYLASRPRSGILENLHLRSPGGSVDEYLTQLSKNKQQLIDQFKTLLETHQEKSAFVRGFVDEIDKLAWVDQIKGGLADKKTPASFKQQALAKGLKVELEHTSDKHMAKEIAMDHLTEDPKYYEKLERMEKGANDPIQKRYTIQGIPISIEWTAGSMRKYLSKTEPKKVTFERKMHADYGYIPGTKDADGEQLDVYVGPDKKSDKVFIINQLKDDGTHDEQKVMVGFLDLEAAKKMYLRHMPPKRLGKVESTTIEAFKNEHLKAAKELKKAASFGFADELFKLARGTGPADPAAGDEYMQARHLARGRMPDALETMGLTPTRRPKRTGATGSADAVGTPSRSTDLEVSVPPVAPALSIAEPTY